MPCKITNFFGSDAYGKFPLGDIENQIIMEWKYWLSYMSNYLDRKWTRNDDFMNYLKTEGIQDEYVSLIMLTVPSPRYEYYQSTDFRTIKKGVLGYISSVVDDLGSYPVKGTYNLL